MSLQKNSLDMLQQVLNSFKEFEKKIDKLQDDVNSNGQTLIDLKIMLAHMSSPIEPINYFETNPDIPTRISKKTSAIHYSKQNKGVESMRAKRRSELQQLPSKMKAKSFQGPKFGRSNSEDQEFLMDITTSHKPVRHTIRPLKAEAPRKATTLRAQKKQIR